MSGLLRFLTLGMLVLSACGEDEPGPTPATAPDPGGSVAGGPSVGVGPGRPVRGPVAPEDRVLFLSPENIQLGQIEDNGTEDVEFEFENRSERMVTIESVATSCKCLSLEAEDRRVRSGEKTRIFGTVRNKGAQSQVRFRVTVVTNCPEQRMVTASVHFWAETQFVPVPRRLDFSHCQQGSEAVQDLKLQYQVPIEKDPIDLVPQILGGLPLSLGEEERSVEEVGRTRKVSHTWPVVVDTSKVTEDEMEGAIRFEATGFHPLLVPVTVRVFGGNWYAERSKVHMGLLDAGETQDRSLKVYFEPQTDAPTASVRTEVPGLEVSSSVMDEGSRPHVLLELTYTAPDEAGEDGVVAGEVILDASFSETPIVLGFGARVRRGD